MKFTTLLALFATATAVAACGDDTKKNTSEGTLVTENDFESTAGWGVDPAALSREQAHSGTYSIFIDPSREFSLTYENALGQLSPQKFKKIRLSAWVYLQSPKGNGSLGIQITDPAQGNKAVSGEGIGLADVVKKYNTWVQVSKDMVLPDNITSANHLKVFLWRGMATQAIYVDDIRISILE
ncbi:hypothetical protein AUC43_04940 [Hymenobacter sedentarius]|uniref:CBM-cenC domain-containing protein n=1 Tax=Hymenobacter sedentarius TaxID=1411621 RepID=A0A0U3SEC0_9BACT|nr:hypothetical protein [Hymenobacter sedentarius]ALW84486.1 hypothetical protein AUC43_04940 [Hymenobacter sedentarius]